ncbi:MBL fold metallo-hydrolase [Martelella alba]|uniref:MBL fold metallo-hydrolase n=1 Tax=Martelella alba TaxID=2590451 RepID=A0ABY2SQ28_9HYPH|nr:MBL fold metallo-hydrolase [Martelella alba]TKI08204.1 MBL fold metallo-hydrolase [Martelella alba]
MPKRNPWYDAAKPHHTPSGFRNLEPSIRNADAFKRWRRERKESGFPRAPQGGYDAFVERWWQRADFSGAEDAIWWLGHACLVMRIAGKYVLIDPALGPRASPLPFVGPKRKTPLAADIADLPDIDLIVYSHNHYDHLDRSSLRRLLRRFPTVQVVTPLGMGDWLKKHGVRAVEECDWWDSLDFAGIRLHCVPARHWSMRSLRDRNRSLWSGWVVDAGDWRFYFSGDSGYTDELTEIGRRLGPFDIAALPIGAYAPEWFMGESHMSPTSAVKFYQQLQCPRVIPIHWGVFELADEALDEPPLELQQALDKAGIAEHQFTPLKIGSKIKI